MISLLGQYGTGKEKALAVSGVSQAIISLNGIWKFSMDPPDRFSDNKVNFQDWPDIQVPGECQMQGFAIRHDRPYVYKTDFTLPSDFEGKQVFIEFHGVYSHARVWINGIFVREHHGGFTRWTCPLPKEVKAGDKVIVTLEITDRSDDISYGSGYAKHQIGGILRKVELRALPEQHFERLYFETDLDDAYRDALLKITYEMALDRPVDLSFRLLDKQGSIIASHTKKIQNRKGIIRIPVMNPEKWDAEHPRLYTLVSTLIEDGSISCEQSDHIGFREVKVDGNRLLVNGMPVKLRGACRHDIHPLLGRMTTPKYDLRDVLLAKECNMNFIRTSHYPPSEAFLDYCDRYGIYVEDETAVCFVGSHRTEAYRASGASQEDPDFTDRYLTQLDEMLHHHRNHPSVIIWSIGNENTFGNNFTRSYKRVQETDSSRPVIYSYPGQVPDSLRNYEILSMHYPSWQGNLKQHGISTSGFAYTEMPVLFDEWAHVSCYNNFELKEDPNVRNFWEQSLDSMWSKVFEAEGGLGGAIWCMLDETFMLPPDLPGFNQWWGILDKNVIPAAYMGPCVGYGEWGIVDTWRRKKPEFWATKKAYSPARIQVKQIENFTPGFSLSIPVHNRFDHTNFRELKITWEHAGQTGKLVAPDIKPHDKGRLTIPAHEWEAGESLQLTFYQKDTLLVDSYALRLGEKKVTLPLCQSGSSAELEVLEEEARIRLRGTGFSLEINRMTGLLENVQMEGDTLIVSGPYLNLRVPGDAIQYSTLIMDDLAENWNCRHTRFRLEQGLAILKTEGSYDRARASFQVKIDGRGILEITFEAGAIRAKSAKSKTIQEAGIKFITGNTFKELSWEREPYFTSYPHTHTGRARGAVDLHDRARSAYREEPHHEWGKDTHGFYYFGLDAEMPYTHETRSMKANIYDYMLATEPGSRLKVHSDGTQACRFDSIRGQNILFINDLWDYNSLMWGNYMKRIPLQRSLSGKAVLSLTGPGMD